MLLFFTLLTSILSLQDGDIEFKLKLVDPKVTLNDWTWKNVEKELYKLHMGEPVQLFHQWGKYINMTEYKLIDIKVDWT